MFLTYPNDCFQHVFSWVLAWVFLSFFFFPLLLYKVTKIIEIFGMIRANTCKHSAGGSSPLLKCIGCTHIIYSSLSEVIISLEALLGFGILLEAMEKLSSQRYYC